MWGVRSEFAQGLNFDVSLIACFSQGAFASSQVYVGDHVSLQETLLFGYVLYITMVFLKLSQETRSMLLILVKSSPAPMRGTTCYGREIQAAQGTTAPECSLQFSDTLKYVFFLLWQGSKCGFNHR